MTLFESMLNLAPSTIAEISKRDECEIKFIAQALVAMGDDELKEGEICVDVISATSGNWYKVGERYRVIDPGSHWEVYRVVPGSGGGIRKDDCEIVRVYERGQ